MGHDNAALTRLWFDTAWNDRDDAAITRLASPDVIVWGLGDDPSQPICGHEPFKRFRAAFLRAFPDLRVRVEDVLSDGDRTAVRLTMTGTHTGDGLGVSPTGRPFTATAICIIRWRDGRVVESWNEFDAAGMMRQLQAPAARLRG